MQNYPQGVLVENEINDGSFSGRIGPLCADLLTQIPDTAVVLDICSGEGGNSRQLFPKNHVYGLEYSIEHCVRGKAAGSLQICGDAEVLPFADNSVAVALFFDGIEHLSDPVKSLREVHRVLHPGALLFITTPLMPWIGFRRLHDYGSMVPQHIRRVHLREYSFGFPGLIQKQGFSIIRQSSHDPLGYSMLKKIYDRMPDTVRWFFGCTQLVVAQKLVIKNS